MTAETSPTFTDADIRRYRNNLKEEVDGRGLYLLLAEAEDDPNLKKVFERLAGSEESHIGLWQEKLREAGAEIPDFRPSMRVRVLGLARSPLWHPLRHPHRRAHGAQRRHHVRRPAPRPSNTVSPAPNVLTPASSRSSAASPARASTSHKSRGATAALPETPFRAAVLGANDGLVSNLSLVMGVAGADPGREFVALAGIAGLLAGAISMALGEWISVLSSREAFSRQVEIEREELEMNPEEERAELVLIYQAKGLSEESARLTRRPRLREP